MPKFRIPKTVVLMGQEITIRFDETLYDHHDTLGITHPDNNEIVLQPPVKGKVALSVVEQTYLHELNHFKLYLLGYKDLYKDEQLVDGLAQLEYQVFHTATY